MLDSFRAAAMRNFGKYEIVAKIGEGGFGIVYEAFDPRIERRVAIKTCPVDDATLRQRFLHEARISGNLQHRNIIVVYDYGEEGDIPYLVQEFLSGEDLDRKISRGDELALETKIDYLIQAAEGLDHAHQQGVIHRDIKPSNIRILDDGQVKIMDFGIAKLRDSELALTLPGQTVGTPAYLAPEQIRNLELDARSDVYAFGLLGYELLTYRKAFPSKNASRVLFQILNEEPKALTELWPECPEDLANVLERCYRKERSERWSSLVEVGEALRELLDRGLPNAMAPPAAAQGSRDVDRNSETMVTPGGTLEDARRAIQEAAAARTAATRHTVRTGAVEVDVGAPAPEPSATIHGRSEPGPEPPATAGGLDHVSLGGLGTDSLQPSIGRSPSEPRGAGSAAARIAAALAVLAILGWLGLRFLGPGEPTEPVASTEAGTAPEASAFEPVPPEPVSDQPASEATTTGASESATGAAPPASAPPAPAKAAPPPPKSVVELRASWDPTMTAKVGDREPVLLDRNRTIELTAGEPVTVTFSSDRADFTASESVTLAADRPARSVLETPISPPGALTIRAGLGAPRLHVSVDGEPVGWTPVNTRLVPAGSHSVSVASDDTDTPEATRSFDLELASQEEVVLTFDLRRATPSVARRPYRN